MAKTNSSGSSKDHRSRRKSRSTSSKKLAKFRSTSPEETLPQCKVKRNYTCSKCTYYTQNPRSFLHHLKNEHAERLHVYECSQCIYASRHSQKLHRHVQMVHEPNCREMIINRTHGHAQDITERRLVPPVRIRVPRFMNNQNNDSYGELVIAENEDVDDPDPQSDLDEDNEDLEEEEIGEEETDEAQNEQDQDIEEEEVAEGEQEEDFDEEDEQDDAEMYASDDAPVDLDEMSVSVVSPTTPSKSKPKKLNKIEKQSSSYIRCSVCTFGSHSQTLVNRHEKMAHLKKKFFRCMKCNYVTHMRARYTKHVKYHTMPMIKCDDCDFSTPYKWNLDRHNRNHSTVNPGTYKCSNCSFSADIKQSLTVHETNHHVPPVGSMLICPAPTRRRARVGASDAPGSSVDGTEVSTVI